MFGFIKNFIAGILDFITGLLPGKKKGDNELSPAKKKSNGYFLELDEAKSIKPLETIKEAAKEVASNTQKAADKVATETKKAVETVTTETKKAADKVVSDSKKEVETVPSDATSSNGKKAPASIADSKPAKASKNGKAPKGEPKPEVTPAASKVAKIPTETTFAPKYLAPSATSSNGRRRPGANMTSFLDMARNVKTPG